MGRTNSSGYVITYGRAPTIDQLLDFIQRHSVINDAGCWIWQRTSNGHVPQNRIKRGERSKVENLTQAIWEASHGQRAGGSVFRACGDLQCVNPHHLTTEPPDPNNYGCRKLSTAQVSYLRRRYRDGMQRGELIDMIRIWGVSVDALNRAARGDTYKDVRIEPRPTGRSRFERFQVRGVDPDCPRAERAKIAAGIK
jgi:hypothetical protein